MKTFKSFFIFILFISSLNFAIANQVKTVFLDSGHTLQHPGTRGFCDTPEVWVNDQVTLKLTRQLQSLGYKVLLSRSLNVQDQNLIQNEPGREPTSSLRQRVITANNSNADLFISIHHDSIKEEELVPYSNFICSNKTASYIPMGPSDFFKKHYTVGFNTFIHSAPNNTLKFNNSRMISELVGKEFIKMGMPVANFHVPEFEDSCSSCLWVNKNLGVMSRNLMLVRISNMPSVLIEVTNLRLPEMEKQANDPVFQSNVANSIANAIDSYFKN